MLDQRILPHRLVLAAGLTIAVALMWAPAREAAAQTGGLRYTIMVSKFQNESNFAGWLQVSGAWDTILTDKLNQSGRFIVVGEGDMREEAMKEQTMAASGLTAQGNKAPVRGQLTPAQLLVKGTITDYQHNVSGDEGGLSFKGIGLGRSKENTEISATIYIVDSSTGSVVASTSVTGTATDKKTQFRIQRDGINAGQSSHKNESAKAAMADALEEAVGWMVGQLDRVPWKGAVVKVAGDQIYINRGLREGVSAGMTLAVGESELIRDPGTGEVLDEIVTERARIEVVSVRDKTSTAKVVSGDATTIYEGMGVSPVS